MSASVTDIPLQDLVAAVSLGLVMGFWLGAYLMHLSRDTNQTWGQRFAKGSAAIAGMGGIPSASIFFTIENAITWCVLGYTIALFLPTLVNYIRSFRNVPDGDLQRQSGSGRYDPKRRYSPHVWFQVLGPLPSLLRRERKRKHHHSLSR